MSDYEETDSMTDTEARAGKITMLEGGKVLFDETVGLQPVTLVEVPVEPTKAMSHGRTRRRGR
jgi:hypothetical protein